MKRRAIVLFGVPGAGKTYYADRWMSGMRRFDITQVYEDVPDSSWDSAVCSLIAWALHSDAPMFILEGLFLPDTPSRRLLEKLLEHHGIESEFVQVHAPLEVCEDRIVAQNLPNTIKRLLILRRYHSQAEEYAAEVVPG